MADPLEIEPQVIKRPGDVVDAKRRGAAVNAMFNAYVARGALRSIELLQEHRPDAPQATGPERQARATAEEKATATAVQLRDLADLADGDYPWRQWATTFEQRLREAEEAYLGHVDEADNPDAYGVTAEQAQLDADNAATDILAFRELIAELRDKAPPLPRAARRAAGQRGPTTRAKPPAEPQP